MSSSANRRANTWIRKLRRVVAQANDTKQSMMIELLLLAAAEHQHMTHNGHPLSRDDFLGWAGDCYDKVKSLHHTPDDTSV